MSRSELADAVNAALYGAGIRDEDVDANYIGKLERGLHRWPSVARRRAFQHVLGVATSADLGFYIRRTTRDDVVIAPRAAPEQPVAPLPVAATPAAPFIRPASDRHICSVTGSCGVESVGEPAAELIAATPRAGTGEDVMDVLKRIHRLSRTIDPEIIRQLSGVVHEIATRYEEFDHAEILPVLRKQRAWVEQLLDECSHAAQRQQLFEIAAGASGLLGYLAVGRSDFPLARAYCAEAFKLADLAQDLNLQAWARGLQSFCEYYARDYVAALRLAEDGLVYAKSGPQSVRLMANGVARAMGKLGDADGVHRAVDQAYVLMSRNDAAHGLPSSVSFGCYSPAQAASNAATAYVSLGMADRAETYISLALPEVRRSGSPWSRSLVLLDQATALVSSKEGDLERASCLAMDAVGISAGRPIVAVRQRALEFVRDATRRWGETGHIRDVREAVASGAPSS